MSGGLVEQFKLLFAGRTDAVGTEEGGCQRLPGEWVWREWAWERAMDHHLTRQVPIGVYPMVPEPHGDGYVVRWGCIDFDEGEEASWVHACNVRLVFEALDITAWVERSRSKGYHVWTFYRDWVPAELARTAQLAACQIAQAPTREVNPKQTQLRPGKLGNYVRLPYPGALSVQGMPDPMRRVMVHEDGSMWPLDAFLQEATEARLDASDLLALAELYKEPPKPKPKPVPHRTRSVMYGSSESRMTGLAFTIWREGPREGAPRHRTLYALANALAEGGRHTYDEALELMMDADERWGKFHAEGRPEYVEEILRKVWGE